MRKMALIIVLIAVVIMISSPMHIPGDVDRNGIANETDRFMIAGYILGDCSLDPDQIRSADINGDGKITNSDLTLIARI